MADASSSLGPSVMAEDKHGISEDQPDVLDTSNEPEKSELPINVPGIKERAAEPGLDDFLVAFDDDDPLNPRNFTSKHKAFLTFLLGCLAAVGSVGSSVTAPATYEIAKAFHINLTISSFSISLYVLGFAFGPMLWAPLSEIYGRRVSILPALSVVVLFSIGTALSKSSAAVFVTRFFGGVFASAPISNVTAALGDIYAPADRGIAMAFYTVCVSGGAVLGPVIGAGITVNRHLGWRWTEYIVAMVAGVMVVLAFFCLPEVYAPVILKRKAQRLRKETGDARYWHPHDNESLTLSNCVTKYLSRPLRMLVTEPIMACICLYASWVYGLSYLLIVVVEVVFRELRGWSTVVSTLPFLAVFIGILCAMVINILNNPIYKKASQRNKNRAVPEARLPPMVLGGVLFVAGIFWFGWTASADYPWASSVVASGVAGAGLNTIFQQCLLYLVDVYGPYAASATAGNTFLRSVLGFALPSAGQPMFKNLGVPIACTVIGAVGCLALPVPLVLMKYGLKLRKMSKLAPVPDD